MFLQGRRWIFAAALSLWASACGTEPEARLEPELAEATGALNTQSSCGAPQVVSQLPGGGMPAREDVRCEGPWEYSNYTPCYVDKADASCPWTGQYNQTMCREVYSCPHPDFGLADRYTKTVTVTVHGALKGGKRCETDEYGRTTCETYHFYEFSSNCRNAADSAKAAVDDRYEAGVWVVSATASPATSENTWEDTASCTYTLGGYPVYNSQPSETLCGFRDYECDDLNSKIYESCRHPDHGQALNPEECHDAGLSGTLDSTRHYSAPNLTLNELRGSGAPLAVTKDIPGYAPRCTTTDEMPIGSEAQVRAKYDALKAQLQTVKDWRSMGTGPGNVDMALLERVLVKKSKVLFELEGGRFLDTQVDDVVQVYTDYTEGGNRVLARVDPTVDFEWGAGSPAAQVLADHFSVRWTGKVIPRYSEVYTFFTVSDDGVRLWVDGELLIDNWTLHGPTENLGPMVVPLVAGQEYDIRMEFFEADGGATARLLWSSLSQAKEAIPAERLKAPDGSAGLLGEYIENGQAADCRNPWIAPVADPECAEAPTVNALFAMCRRMTLDHVPASTVQKVMERCIDVIESAEAATCTREKYRAAHDELVPALLKEQLSRTHGTTDAERTEALRRKLGYVDRWYAKVRGPLYGGDRMSAALNERTSELLGEFWRGAYTSEFAIGMKLDSDEPAPLPVSVDGIPALSDTYLKVDREVLKAAFPESLAITAPMTSAPLALVVNDALRGLEQRLDSSSDAHDLGCRFRGCSAGKISTEVSHLWKYLGVLSDVGALGAMVDSSAQRVDADWKPVFSRMRLRHEVLASALKDAAGLDTYSHLALEATPQESVAPMVYGLLELMREARARTSSYEELGAFNATLRNSLHTGMNNDSQDVISDLVDRELANLQAAILTYEGNRTTYLQTYLEEMRGERQAARTAAEIQMMNQQVVNLESDLTGMMHNASIASARHADYFVRTFQEMLASPQVAEYRVAQAQPMPVSVSARQAKYTGLFPQLTDDMETLSATGKLLPDGAGAGDVIHIAVTGAWAPVCALGSPAAAMTIPGDTSPKVIATSGITTGPEGFTVVRSETGFTGHAVSAAKQHTTYDTEALSADMCLGARTTASSPLTGLLGIEVEVYARAEACVSLSYGHTGADIDTDSTTEGSDSRSTAAFSAGLRVAGTPFPHLPVGSLLLVEVKKGTTHPRANIQQIHVLQSPASTILIPNRQGVPEVDLYLVVNDRAGCSEVSGAPLQLMVNHASRLGSGEYAEKLLGALAETKAAVDAEGREALKEGRVSAATLASIRSDAYMRLEDACDLCGLSQFPSQLQGLYNAWVDHELAALSRQADILAAQRRMEQLSLELKALGADLARQEGESRLARQMPLWALRDLEGTELSDATRAVTDVVNRYLLPILELRYPEVLTAMRTDPVASKELLALTDGVVPDALGDPRATHWTRSRLETAKQLKSFVARVMGTLAPLRSPTSGATQFPFVAVSFPRPDRPAGWQSYYRTADDIRSRQVWKQFEQGRIVSFTVRPEDLYAYNGLKALPCTEGTMVVRAMGLYLAIPGSQDSAPNMNNLLLYPPVTVDKSLTFATKDGPEVYQQLNSKWLAPWVRPTYGDSSQAEVWFENVRGFRKGNGLSPFTTFEFDLSGLLGVSIEGYNLLDSTEELVLTFEVETEPLAGEMSWISSCVRPPVSLQAPVEVSEVSEW